MLDVVALCRELDGLENIEQCAALFKRAIAPLGFTTYACGEIDLAWRDIAVFYIIDWPDAWRKFYLESGFLDDDPLIEALHARHDPFTWTELRADPRWPVGKTRVLALAAQSGWREGMVVPIRRGGMDIVGRV